MSCTEKYPKDSVNKEVYDAIENYLCPDLEGEKIVLQNDVTTESIGVNLDKNFYFLIGTCKMVNILLKEDTSDCVSDAEVLTFLPQIIVNTKRVTQDFSPVTYKENDDNLTTFFSHERFSLSKFNSIRQAYNVHEQEISFTSRVMYTD